MIPPPDRLAEALADRYRIERTLGEGGMATVYLAHDLKHERDVALKVLKPELAAMIGGERFVLEIKTTANLQHPHILPLFDSGEAGGFLFYVMPYVDGESLRDRLDREGQIGVDEALRITRDVADALDYAHRRGVIHRDIKPENILLQDGRPIVADFGIAVAISAAGGGRMTETGLSLGTPHYMSPEQATAERDLSARSDVYSLACVLYEMLAGDPPHTGPNAQAVLIRILTEAPRSVTQIRSSVPPHVSAVLVRALEKLPADRFESAKAFAEALGNEGFTYRTRVRAETGGTTGPAAPAGPVPATWRKALPWGIAAASLALAAWAATPRGGADGPARVVRLDLDLDGIDLATATEDVVISPDGSMLVAAGVRDGVDALYLREIDEDDWRMVPGTEGGTSPSFSPDNLYLLYRDPGANALVRVSVQGGSMLTMASLDGVTPFHSHWGKDGSISFTSPQGAFVVPPDGGAPVRISPGRASGGRRPYMLPDGSGVLSGWGSVSVYDIATDSSWTLVPDAAQPIYLESGHLLYVASSGGLFAQAFDLETKTLSGVPSRVLDEVAFNVGRRGFSVSDGGTLVHLKGDPGNPFAGTGTSRFVEVTPDGAVDTLPVPPGILLVPKYSPDGQRIVYEAGEGSDGGVPTQLHISDLTTGTVTPLTFTEDNEDPIWSPDGTRVVFDREGTVETEADTAEDLYIKWADNRSPEEPVLVLPGDQNALAWLPDDRILFESQHEGNWDLFVISLDEGATPEPYLRAPWEERSGQVSPDGDFVAYVSNETNESVVWLRSFPEPTAQLRVSPGAGEYPRWAPDGSGVYFWTTGSTTDTLKFAPVERDPAVRVLNPDVVLVFPAAGIENWDVHPGGDRFLVRTAEAGGSLPVGGERPRRYLVVLDWFRELQERLDERNR